MTEKMITIAKKDDLAAKRQVLAYVTKEDVAKKLFDEIAPKYADVNGGYTRITKTGPRRGDAAEMCIIELLQVRSKTRYETESCVIRHRTFFAFCPVLGRSGTSVQQVNLLTI